VKILENLGTHFVGYNFMDRGEHTFKRSGLQNITRVPMKNDPKENHTALGTRLDSRPESGTRRPETRSSKNSLPKFESGKRYTFVYKDNEEYSSARDVCVISDHPYHIMVKEGCFTKMFYKSAMDEIKEVNNNTASEIRRRLETRPKINNFPSFEAGGQIFTYTMRKQDDRFLNEVKEILNKGKEDFEKAKILTEELKEKTTRVVEISESMDKLKDMVNHIAKQINNKCDEKDIQAINAMKNFAKANKIHLYEEDMMENKVDTRILKKIYHNYIKSYLTGKLHLYSKLKTKEEKLALVEKLENYIQIVKQYSKDPVNDDLLEKVRSIKKTLD
jgi:hypothetical protein